MAIEKIKFTSETASATQNKINANFEELDLDRATKEDVFRYSTMPTASASNVGKIVQFIGTTNTYTNGYFYKCVLDNSDYVWEMVNVQPHNTKTSDLTNDGDGESPFATQAYVAQNGGKIDSISVDNVTQTIDANKNVNIDLSSKQNTSNNIGLNTTDKSIVGAINEVNSKAEGREKATSYASISAMVTGLNAMSATELKVGDNIFIQALDVPDLWVYSVESTSSTYTYTTDSAFVSAINTNGYVQIGYYKVSKLESDKIDLSGYVPNTRTIAGVDLQDNITKSEMKTALDVDDLENNTTKIHDSNGGFAGGESADAGDRGGAVGYLAKSAGGGFAGGANAKASSSDDMDGGGAVGSYAYSNRGGAVGAYAKAGAGFSGGANANVKNDGTAQYPRYIDAIQLGGGTNNTERTLQVYSDNIYNATSHTLTVNNITLNGSDLSTTISGKQDAISTLTFTDSDAGWGALTSGYYTLTIPSSKIPFICFNSSGVQIMCELSYDGTNIYVKTDTKFSGKVIAI